MGEPVDLYTALAPGGSYDSPAASCAAPSAGIFLGISRSPRDNACLGACSFDRLLVLLYARAPKDGIALGIVSQTMATEEALGTPGA